MHALVFVGVVAFVAGCVVTGLVAHRWPTVFNKAIAVANAVDGAANQAAAQAKAAAQAAQKK